MNTRQLGLMIHMATGRVILVRRLPHRTIVVKDVTADFALMLAAEIMQGGGEGIASTYEARDGYGNVMEVEVQARIVSQRKVDL